MIPVTDIQEAPGSWAPLEIGWVLLDLEHPGFADTKWRAVTPELELMVLENGESIAEFLASANTFGLANECGLAGMIIVGDEHQVTYWLEQSFVEAHTEATEK